MIKFCPDLTGKEEVKAILRGTSDFVRPVLHTCIKEKCIAYKDGMCGKYHSAVEVEEVENSERRFNKQKSIDGRNR